MRRCGAELLWNRFVDSRGIADRVRLLTHMPAGGDVGVIFQTRFSGAVSRPGSRHATAGRFVVLLQWARIVTESQYGTATGRVPGFPPPIPENITRRQSKSDGRARFAATGFSRVPFGLPDGSPKGDAYAVPDHPCRAARVVGQGSGRAQARQASRPSVIRSCGSSMPMKTILLVFFSTGCHFAARSLPIIWWTPWNTTFRSTPFMYSTPL